MIVLGFDTATAATAVGLRLGDAGTLQARDDPPPGARPGHATHLLPLAGELLEQAGIGWERLERIAVGVGPGTFTGLRIGVATARGLAQSLGIALVGVSSLRALAYAAFAQAGEEVDGVIAVIDARRGEAFAAVYGKGAMDDLGAELLAPAVLAPEELAGLPARVRADELAGRWLAVGDGAVRFADQLHTPAILLAPEDSPLHRVSGEAVCALSEALQPGDAQAVTPRYLRRPDAEIALLQAHA